MLMSKDKKIQRHGIYNALGDYHKNLNPKWAYYPIYLEKVKFVESFLNKRPKHEKILDIGSGDGHLVEYYLDKGRNISGIDINYSSALVKKGDILNIPYRNKSFDIVLCMDMLQYLTFREQSIAISEIKRVLKSKGFVIFSIPNLAHFSSRVYFLLTGKLMRTDSKTFPAGDRPINEYIDMIKRNFKIITRK